RIAHETKWVDERGVIVKFEASGDEAAPPMNDNAKPANHVPMTPNHPDLVRLKAKYGVTDTERLGLTSLMDKPLELKQAILRTVISREQALCNVSLGLGDQNAIALHSGKMLLAQLELANLQQQIATGQSSSDEVEFVAKIKRNSWV